MALAISHWETAAEEGSGSAMLRLAQIYADGLYDVPVDTVVAEQWALNAVDAGVPDAVDLLDRLPAHTDFVP